MSDHATTVCLSVIHSLLQYTLALIDRAEGRAPIWRFHAIILCTCSQSSSSTESWAPTPNPSGLAVTPAAVISTHELRSGSTPAANQEYPSGQQHISTPAMPAPSSAVAAAPPPVSNAVNGLRADSQTAQGQQDQNAPPKRERYAASMHVTLTCPSEPVCAHSVCMLADEKYSSKPPIRKYIPACIDHGLDFAVIHPC